MKVLIVVISVAAFACSPALARGGGGHSGGTYSTGSGSHSIKGYTKKDGTYVAPAHAKNPNTSKFDNWSSKGNTNPYTGKEGAKDPITGK